MYENNLTQKYQMLTGELFCLKSGFDQKDIPNKLNIKLVVQTNGNS